MPETPSARDSPSHVRRNVVPGRHGQLKVASSRICVAGPFRMRCQIRPSPFIAFETVLWRGSRSAPSGDEVDDRHAHLDLLVPPAQDEDELPSFVQQASNLRT